jgi:hypothetical protein
MRNAKLYSVKEDSEHRREIKFSVWGEDEDIRTFLLMINLS